MALVENGQGGYVCTKNEALCDAFCQKLAQKNCINDPTAPCDSALPWKCLWSAESAAPQQEKAIVVKQNGELHINQIINTYICAKCLRLAKVPEAREGA